MPDMDYHHIPEWHLRNFCNIVSDPNREEESVWLKLRASLYEAQIGLGARLVSAKLPLPPCASLAPNPPPPRAPR